MGLIRGHAGLAGVARIGAGLITLDHGRWLVGTLAGALGVAAMGFVLTWRGWIR